MSAAPLNPAAASADAITCPALLVAAPASGQGKTTVVAALARLLARRGQRVRVFKCGPDFLDPFWHRLASGHAVHNLDEWMCGEADIRARLHAAAQQADVLLIEGVMGLHDGAHSSARLARRLGVPVLLVAQAASMAQTLGAVVHGMRHYRAAQHGPLPWAGVLANGVAGEGHARLLQQALDETHDETQDKEPNEEGQGAAPPAGWLGHLPTDEAMHLPERHLGLVAAHDMPLAQAQARLDAAADRLEQTPLGQLTPADWRARWGVRFAAPAQTPALPPLLAGRTVAVARDAAFAFVYESNLDTLRALGAQLLFFSPLAGDALPDCDALWLPGGYPELHAATLAARHGLRAALHRHAQAGKPVWAECGGLLALMDGLTDVEGQRHALWGLLPGQAVMQRRLAGLGMQAWAVPDAPHAPPLRGHAFHYGRCDTALPPIAHTTPAPGSARRQGEAVYAQGSVRGSFFHPWFASSPQAAAALFLPADGPRTEPA